MDFPDLLLTPGIGARTLQSLAMVAELVHGTPTAFATPDVSRRRMAARIVILIPYAVTPGTINANYAATFTDGTRAVYAGTHIERIAGAPGPAERLNGFLGQPLTPKLISDIGAAILNEARPNSYPKPASSLDRELRGAQPARQSIREGRTGQLSTDIPANIESCRRPPSV